MSSQQNTSQNRISAKTVALLSLLTALALIFSFVESLFTVTPISGIKLGLANGLCLLLICRKKYAYAAAVNFCRILLSTFLFSTPFALLFSLTGAVFSFIAAFFTSKLKIFSAAGVSIISAAVHNASQLLVAVAVFRTEEIFYYLPVLLIAGAVSGLLVGIFDIFFEKKCGKFLKNVV